MVGVLLIATRKYKSFVPFIVGQIEKYFNQSHEILLFTDRYVFLYPAEYTKVIQFIIPSYGFPEATLYRYAIFHKWSGAMYRYDSLLYLDIDMGFADTVFDFKPEGLLAVHHPGFYKNNGWGDSNNPKESNSYLPIEKRKNYYCGGVQGGETKEYLKACKMLSELIADDEKRGVRAEWNDETFWNWYLHTQGVKISEFPPSYCMPEQIELRKSWGIDDLPVKIIALAKDHKTMRE